MFELLGPLVLFAAAMCLTPGPNVVMVTAAAVDPAAYPNVGARGSTRASSANFGFRRTVPQILGVALGFGVMIMAAGLGLAGLFQAAPRLHALLKYAGAAYLLYLAWRIAQADAARGGAAWARPINFVEAVLFTWVNPKGWVTTVGALSAAR